MTRAEQYQSVRNIIMENIAEQEMREAYKRKELAVFDRVLEIIDEKHDDFRDGSFRDDSITYAQAWKRSNEVIRAAVLALKGGEKT